MNKKYIECEAAVDALNKALFAYEDETEARFKNDPELDISEWFFHRIFVQRMNEIDRQTVLYIPAADVAPVRRGRWVDKNAGNATCSVCKRRHKDVYDDDASDLFCRSCGADCRGDANGE